MKDMFMNTNIFDFVCEHPFITWCIVSGVVDAVASTIKYGMYTAALKKNEHVEPPFRTYNWTTDEAEVVEDEESAEEE